MNGTPTLHNLSDNEAKSLASTVKNGFSAKITT